ncbi:hypothetical protein NFJ02_42g109350 [Pycnococcus provasolii]
MVGDIDDSGMHRVVAATEDAIFSAEYESFVHGAHASNRVLKRRLAKHHSRMATTPSRAFVDACGGGKRGSSSDGAIGGARRRSRSVVAGGARRRQRRRYHEDMRSWREGIHDDDDDDSHQRDDDDDEDDGSNNHNHNHNHIIIDGNNTAS